MHGGAPSAMEWCRPCAQSCPVSSVRVYTPMLPVFGAVRVHVWLSLVSPAQVGPSGCIVGHFG